MKQQEINKLLDEYRKGIISTDNRKKLEQLSIEDDFVFDALEGMNSEKNSSSSSRNLDVLRGRLENRVTSQKQRKIAWWIPSAAAAILLIFGSMWVFQDDSNSSESAGVYAKAEKKESESNEQSFELDSNKLVYESVKVGDINSSEASDQEYSDDNQSANQDEVTYNTGIVKEQGEIIETRKEKVANSPVIASKPVPASKSSASQVEKDASNIIIDGVALSTADEVMVEQEADEDVQEEYASDDAFHGDLNTEYSPERKKESEPAAPSAAKLKKRAMAESPAESTITYSGTIMDNYDQPLIGASVQIKGTNIATVSDVDGNVVISGIIDENARAIVSYTGFETVEIPLTQDFRVAMQEGALLSEVVVTSNTKRSAVPAGPVIGWYEFNELVKEKLGGNFGNSDIEINFRVGNNGNARLIKIKKGKDLPETKVLIELIKEQQWTKGKGTVSY